MSHFIKWNSKSGKCVFRWFIQEWVIFFDHIAEFVYVVWCPVVYFVVIYIYLCYIYCINVAFCSLSKHIGTLCSALNTRHHDRTLFFFCFTFGGTSALSSLKQWSNKKYKKTSWEFRYHNYYILLFIVVSVLDFRLLTTALVSSINITLKTLLLVTPQIYNGFDYIPSVT